MTFGIINAQSVFLILAVQAGKWGGGGGGVNRWGGFKREMY